MSEQKIIMLEPSLLKACVPAMSNEATRYYLNGVHIKEHNGYLVYQATNGHLLVRCHSSLEQEEDITGVNAIIPDFFAKELSKSSFLKGFGVIGEKYLTAVIHGRTISIEMPNGIASNQLVDGTFPDTDIIIDSAHKRGVNACDDLSLNIEYVSKIEKSVRAFDRNSVTRMAIEDGSKPLYFSRHGDLGHWEAVLMPCRS